MLTPSIDRTLLPVADAVDWLLSTQPPAIPLAAQPVPPARPPWERPPALPRRDLAAREALLVLLRDGDLHGVGRFSSTPAAAWETPHHGRRWIMHSGRPSHITPEQWRGGVYNWGQDALDLPDGQYVEIRVPQLMLRAIWPAAEPRPDVCPDGCEPSYSTPYLELMRRAIAEHAITAECQPKKETLVAWFKAQQISGAPVSESIAGYLATFVRVPEAQRGGNRKWREAS